MRQLIARVDDELHARLKARAAAEGRSLNDLVTEALAAALGQPLTRRGLRARSQAAGVLAQVPAPRHPVDRERVIESTRGLGTAVSEALDADRGAW